jgi:3-hydroxymyristoyl/3-hydroxydecanoyl-(acyl carrier protein) dehydratase/acyl carrier protein
MSHDAPNAETPTLPDDLSLLNRIREFVADAADIPLERVGPDDDIYLDLAVDSLGAAAIFIDIAYHFNIPEPQERDEFVLLNTPSKIVLFVKRSAAGDCKPIVPVDFNLPEDLSAILPYGEDFRFIDSVISIEIGRIVARTTWRENHPLIAAHFKDGPHVVPGVLLAEQAAQSALLLARLRGLVGPTEHLLLHQIRCDFRAPALPPLTIETTVDFRATGFGHYGFKAICASEGIEFAHIKGIAVKKSVGDGSLT